VSKKQAGTPSSPKRDPLGVLYGPVWLGMTSFWSDEKCFEMMLSIGIFAEIYNQCDAFCFGESQIRLDFVLNVHVYESSLRHPFFSLDQSSSQSSRFRVDLLG